MFPENIHLYSDIRQILLTGFAVFCLLFSCRQEKTPEPYFTHGAVRGTIILVGDYNDPIEFYDGITVTLSGPYGDMETQTDKQGNYVLSGLGNGTYELTAEKDGFGTKKYFGIQVFGTDTIILNNVLYKSYENAKPPELVADVSLHYNQLYGPDHISIETDYACCTGNPYPALMFFISDDEGVDCYHFRFSVRAHATSLNSRITYAFNYINLTDGNSRLLSGVKYYVKGYPCNPEVYYDDDSYWDPYRQMNIFPTMNYNHGTNTFGFIVP